LKLQSLVDRGQAIDESELARKWLAGNAGYYVGRVTIA